MNKEVPILQQIREGITNDKSMVSQISITSSEDAYNIYTEPTVRREGKYYGFAIAVKSNGGIFGGGPEKVSLGLDTVRIPVELTDEPLHPGSDIYELEKTRSELHPGELGFILYRTLHKELQEIKPLLQEAMAPIHPGIRPGIFQYRHEMTGMFVASQQLTRNYRTVIGTKEIGGNDGIDVSLEASSTIKTTNMIRDPEFVIYSKGDANVESLGNRSSRRIEEGNLDTFTMLNQTIKNLYKTPYYH